MPLDEWGFYRSVTRIIVIQRECSRSSADGMPFFGLCHLHEIICQVNEFDASPERTEVHPWCTLFINDDVGVDGIPHISVRDGLDDHAMVCPMIFGRLWI